MANPPDNDQNKKPGNKTPERNLATPATTRPTESLKDKAANVAASTTDSASKKLDQLSGKTDTSRPLSTNNLADKVTNAGDQLKSAASRTTAAGTSAISGAAAAGSGAAKTAGSTVTGAAAAASARAKTSVAGTAQKFRDSANTPGQSANLAKPRLPDTDSAPSRPARPAAPGQTPAIPGSNKPGTSSATQAPRGQRPATPPGAAVPPSRSARPATSTPHRTETRTRQSAETTAPRTRSPLERPKGLDQATPRAQDRTARPESRPPTRPTTQSAADTTERTRVAARPPQDRRPAGAGEPAPRRAERGPALSQNPTRAHDDRPRRPGPPPRRPDMRPREDRPAAHFRDDPRPRRRMAPPPGASKNGYFTGRPLRKGPPPIDPSSTPEGGAWGPLLFGLLLLCGVAWYAIRHYTPQIQEDLLRRSNASLDQAGITGQTDVAISGRNIVLSGTVATQADSDSAEQAVADTFGVRAVENELVIGDSGSTATADAELGQPSLAMTRQGDSVTLAGTVSDEKFATALTSAAVTQYGEANVSGEISVDENVTNPGWLSAVTQLMPEMDSVEDSGLSIEGGTLTLNGTTTDANTKEALGSKASELLKGHLTIDNQIVAPEPEPVAAPAPAPAPVAEPEPAPRVLPAFASVKETDDQITLSGFMSEESATLIASAYADNDKQVVNNISVNDLAESPAWVDTFTRSMAGLDNVQNGKVTIARSGNVTLEGVVGSESLKQSAGEEISALFGEEHQIINNIVVELPPVVPTMTAFASVIEGESQINVSGLLPKPSARALLNSYRSGEKLVVDNIAIDERVIAPAWTEQLSKSLAAMDNIADRKVNITSSGELILRGHAQTEDARQTAADNLTALFGNSVSLRNDISVETPKIAVPPKPDFSDLLAQIDIAGIRFRTNSSELNGDSVVILEQVANLLNQYQNVEVEIAGHTDSRGSRQYNLDLSADRAATVMQFLGNRGIVSDRMTAKGYGPAEPIASNDTAAGRAQNRRIEFTLTGE